MHVTADARATRTGSGWLDDRFTKLAQVGKLFANPQARFGNVAMAVPKKDTYRIVDDYRVVNNLVATTAMPMSDFGEIGRGMAGAGVFLTLDLIQGCWQMPLDPQAQEIGARLG